VGSYEVNGSGLSSANYIFAQAAGNATALTINPATLLYVSDAASRTVGAANPAFSGTVSGFVNADSQSSATSGNLVFASTAAATSPAGSYAINGSGLSAANYLFAQSPANATALTVNPAAAPPVTPPVTPPDTAPVTPPTTLVGDAVTVLTSFTASSSPPVTSSLTSNLGTSQTTSSAPPPPPPAPPPPPPPPPPAASPLATNNTTDDGQPAEPPNSSDQSTSQVASSLEGGAAAADSGGGGVVIPKMLVNSPPPPPPPTDASALPSFGNSALWQ
jgi:hypothetical protein